VLRTEFNADNAKIDAALTGEANQSALKSLQGTLDGLSIKLDSLQTTVSGHTSALDQKGNCVLYTTSYRGNGSKGAPGRTLTFPSKPWAVFIAGFAHFTVLLYGVGRSLTAGTT